MRAIRAMTILAAVMFTPMAVEAQKQSVEYEISFPNAAQHEARVIATFRGLAPGSTLNALMSRSSPGRYAVANFAKNVYDVVATDGRNRSLETTRVDSHEWAVRGHDGTVRMSYTVWGDRIDGTFLSIDHSHAHLNMPATFMFARNMASAAIRLRIVSPAGWQVATQLVPASEPGVFTAPNLQWFMDSPTEVGPVTIRSWSSSHNGSASTVRLAVHHLGTPAEVDSFALMARSVVEESIAVWGEPAGYDKGVYTFIADYLPWANGDGMEHRNSTIITGRTPLSSRQNRIDNLGTLSHEFFHTWNMERLRSKGIEPFAFDREDMSSDLWFGEGFTSYYGPLIIRRAGFYTDEEYARIIGNAVITTIDSPARRHGSAQDMSRQAPFFDGASWLDPTNRPNLFLSYYTWGSVIALGLDLTLRERYGITLDDYMRALWRDYGKRQSPAFAPVRPYTINDLRNSLAAITRDPAFAADYFRRYIEGREVPDFAKLLEPAGMRLSLDSAESPYLGASMDNDSGKVFVNWSAEGGSMFDAGIASGDIIYAVDGMPAVSIDSLDAMISRKRVGAVVNVDVEQRLVRRTVPMTIRGRKNIKLTTFEAAALPVTESIRKFRSGWLDSRR